MLLLMSLDLFKSSVRHYTQQHPFTHVPEGLSILRYDGVAEVWFDSLSSAMAIFGHQDYISIAAKDEDNFLDRTKTVLFLSSEPGGFENFMFALRDVRLPDGLLTLISISEDYGIKLCVRLQMISQAIKKTSGRRTGAARPNQNVKRLPWISGKASTEATCVA